MRRTLGILGIAVVGLALVGITSAAAAEESQQEQGRGKGRGAIAIGQLRERDGGVATIDLRAASGRGRTAGNLHFYSPEHGYYNGAVRSLSVQDGAITASGGGALTQPDGQRVRVRFDAYIPADGRNVTISVQGRDGFAYTLAGNLDPGLVKAGDPRAALKRARSGDRPKLPARV